jgi:hypothetical protein
MLLKIPAEKTGEYRERIKEALQNAAPPFVEITEEKIERTMGALFDGRIEAWLIIFGEVLGIVLTRISEDDLLDLRDLLVYCIYLQDGCRMSDEMWDDCYDRLSDYCSAFGCVAITAYTIVERVRRMALRMGGRVDVSYVRVPVRR